jgi:2-isopropylmalate synthase
VEFSAEDAGRSELDFLCRITEAVIDAGARTINIPDTVGYNVPEQFAQPSAVDRAGAEFGSGGVLGALPQRPRLAVANSLSAVLAGARQVECTINGLGERAGNASLEEIVMAVRTRRDMFSWIPNIDTTQIVTCLAAGLQHHRVPGAAQQGHRRRQRLRPRSRHPSGRRAQASRDLRDHARRGCRLDQANRMVLGKHSGRNAFRTRLEELGVSFDSEETLNAAFARFKELADKKHEIFDEDLQALVTDANLPAENERVKLVSAGLLRNRRDAQRAGHHLAVDGEERQAGALGSGPVDAAFRAIEAIVHSGTELQLYSVNNITSGTDAQGEVTVRLEKGGRIVNGQGADTDIVVASAKAYINALNKVLQPPTREHPQLGDV